MIVPDKYIAWIFAFSFAPLVPGTTQDFHNQEESLQDLLNLDHEPQLFSREIEPHYESPTFPDILKIGGDYAATTGTNATIVFGNDFGNLKNSTTF